MNTARSRTASQRHRVWLLWLALLLPMAQAAAAWHALSHTAADAGSEGDGKHALHQTHCDLCLTAATVSGGALPVEPHSLPRSAARHEAPQGAFSGIWFALPTRAYHSRAPPFAPH